MSEDEKTEEVVQQLQMQVMEIFRSVVKEQGLEEDDLNVEVKFANEQKEEDNDKS